MVAMRSLHGQLAPVVLVLACRSALRRGGNRIQLAQIYFKSVRSFEVDRGSDGLEIYEVAEPVPASTFVGATQTVEALADGWSRVYLDAEDGSRWARSLRRGDVD